MHRLINIVFCLYLILSFTSVKVFSQNTINQTERNFHINVKQFGEFIDRFNYKTDFKGEEIDSFFISKVPRKMYLELLFNNQDKRLSENNQGFLTNYSKLIKQFVDEIDSKELYIDKHSANIIAEAKSIVIYKGSEHKVSIFLNQEIENKGVKWVISSVKADFLNTLKTDTVLLRFIPPTSNETNFISLKRVFDDSNHQHYYAEKDNGRQWNHPQGSPDRLEYIIDRIIEGHLRAFPKTPGAMNVHLAEFECGLKAFQEGRFWARRDSFQEGIRTQEIAIAQGLQPGTGVVWEQMVLRPDNTATFPNDEEFDSDKPFLLPGRYFDIAAHFVGIGFSPWVNMWAHENCSKTLEYIAQNIGYRIRPAIIWKRQLRGREELVLGLRNDGSSAPPGTIRITADFSDQANEQIELPVGEPVPGKMQMYAIPMPASMWKNKGEVSLSMQIMMKGKIADVQWAAREKSPQQDNNRLVVSL